MRYFFIALIFGIIFQGKSQCGLSKSSYPIVDTYNEGADTTNFSLLISGAQNNSLSSGNQGLCAVRVKFKHPFMKELFIELISPSGQKITLIGGDIVATNTPLITWDVTFVPCAASPSPDAGILPKWENDQQWQSLVTYKGQYHPYIGCLEDYKVGTVNGTWTLRCIDFEDVGNGTLLGAELVFCRQEGIICGECILEPGQISNSDILTCENDSSLLLKINKTFPSGTQNNNLYDYTNVIVKDSIISGYQQNVDMRNQAPGSYNICSVQNAKMQSNNLPGPGSFFSPAAFNSNFYSQGVCASFSENCMKVDISKAIPPTNRIEFICAGSSVQIDGKSYSKAGNYTIAIKKGLCDSVINLDLRVIELKTNIVSSSDSVNCTGNSIVLKGNNIGTQTANLSYLWSTSNGVILGDTKADSLKVLKEGSYKLVISVTNQLYSCQDSVTKVIFRDDSFAKIILVGDTLTCAKDTINITHTISKPVSEKTWTSRDGYQIIITPTGARITKPGLYILSVKGQNGCIASDSILIQDELSFVEPKLTSDKITCSKDSVILKVEHTVSSGSYSYLWTGVPTKYINSKEPSVGAPGSYSVKVKNLKNGCNKLYSISVSENKLSPQINLKVDTINCQNTSVSPMISSDQLIESYRWSGPGFLSFSPSPQLTQNGQYSIEIISAENGCKSSKVFDVQKDTNLPDMILSAEDLSCLVDSVVIMAVPDRPLNSVKWSGPQGFVSDKLQPKVGVIGTYTVTFISENGCMSSKTISIKNSPEVPLVTFRIDSIKCGADTIQIKMINQSGDYKYIWSGPGLLENNVGEPRIITSGMYKVTISDPDSGCKSERTIEIIDDRIYTTADIIYDEISCLKDSVQIILTNQDVKTILYSGPGFSSNLKSPFVKNTGTYNYTLTNVKDCVTSGSIEIVRNDTIPVIRSSFSPIMCFQDSVKLQAGSSINNTKFTWIGPQNFSKTGQDVYAFKGGQYSLSGIAPNGCKSQIDFVLEYDTLRPVFNILEPDPITCKLPTVELQLNIVQSPVTIKWLPGNTSGQNVLVTQPGKYYAEVRGVNNCISIDSVIVKEKRNYPVFEAKSSVINCRDVLSSIQIIPEGFGTTIKWTNATNPTSVPDGVFEYNSSFDGLYRFTLKSMEDCITEGTVMVLKDNARPVIKKQILDTIDCKNSTIDIGVEIDGTGIEYLWNGPNIVDKITEGLLTIKDGGRYFLKITGSNYCSTISEFNVFKSVQLPEFETYTDTLTCDKAKINIGVNPTSVINDYFWIGPDGFESKLGHPKVFTQGLYTVTVTGSNGCTAKADVTVSQDISKPQVLISDIFLLPCDTLAIPLMVMSDNTPLKYKWVFPPGNIVTVASPTTNIPGMYSVQLTGNNGCTSIVKNFEVKIDNTPPKFTYTAGNISCKEMTAQLKANAILPDVIFQWVSPSGIIYNSGTVNTTEAGLYTLRVSDSRGCKDTILLTVEADTIGPDVIITKTGVLECESRAVVLDATGSSFGRPYQTSWTTSNGNISSIISDYVIGIDKEGSYTFAVTNNLTGCTTAKNVEVAVTPQRFTNLAIDNVPPICNEVNNGIIRLASLNGTAPYQITFNGINKGSQTEFFNLSPGIYKIDITDKLGCKLSRQVVVDAGLDLSLNIDNEFSIKFGDSLLLKPEFTVDPSGLATLIWTKRDTIICDDCPELWVRPFVNSIYNLEYSIDGYCRRKKSVLVRVSNDIGKAVPNIFSPGSSGNNQLFFIPQTRGIEKINYIKIFSRWAENVYSGYDLLPGDPTFAWDGTFNGKPVQPGVLLIVAELVLSDGTVWKYQGDVTIIR